MDQYKQTKADRLNHKQGADVRSRMYNKNTLISILGEIVNLKKVSLPCFQKYQPEHFMFRLTFRQVDFLTSWLFGR